MITQFQQTLPFPWRGERQCSLQLLFQPWICAPDTHYGWVDQCSVKYEAYQTVLHMANTGNQTPDLLILNPTPYPLGHRLPQVTICNRQAATTLNMWPNVSPDDFVRIGNEYGIYTWHRMSELVTGVFIKISF